LADDFLELMRTQAFRERGLSLLRLLSGLVKEIGHKGGLVQIGKDSQWDFENDYLRQNFPFRLPVVTRLRKKGRMLEIFKIHGPTICLLIAPEALPPVLVVPEGSALNEGLHRRVLSTYLYGDAEHTPGGTLAMRKELPPLLIEGAAGTDMDRTRQKQEFAAYLWRRVLGRIQDSLNHPAIRLDLDLWIYGQLLEGVQYIQHALSVLEKQVAAP